MKLAEVFVNVLCSLIGGIIGWNWCHRAWVIYRKDMSRRLAILLYAHGLTKKDAAEVMEAKLGNDGGDEDAWLAQKIKTRIRHDARRGAAEGSVVEGTKGER